MSTVIAHMRAAATLDEAARIAAELMRAMSIDMDSSTRRRQDKLARWSRDLEAAVEAANEERIDTELEEVPMQLGVQRMADELRHRAAERAGKDGTASHMVEWQAAKRIEDYEAERRWLINENQRLRALNASHLARVAVAEVAP